MEVTPGKSRDLEPLIANHKTHIGRLEQVMRLLENDQVPPEPCQNSLAGLLASMQAMRHEHSCCIRAVLHRRWRLLS